MELVVWWQTKRIDDRNFKMNTGAFKELKYFFNNRFEVKDLMKYAARIGLDLHIESEDAT